MPTPDKQSNQKAAGVLYSFPQLIIIQVIKSYITHGWLCSGILINLSFTHNLLGFLFLLVFYIFQNCLQHPSEKKNSVSHASQDVNMLQFGQKPRAQVSAEDITEALEAVSSSLKSVLLKKIMLALQQ